MGTTRMTGFMKRSLEAHLAELSARIDALEGRRQRDDGDETTALLAELSRERDGIVEALRDARLIDDDPFDTQAIEIGDAVTIRGADGETERYVLVDGGAGSRPRRDWVSVASPLGAALLGRNTGDVVRVDSPDGVTECEILGFERASGDPRLPSEAFLG